MTTTPSLDRARMAVVIMDFQNGILTSLANGSGEVVERAASVLGAARASGVPVIYVGHRGDRAGTTSPGIDFDPGLTPREGERTITKTRAGAFSTTGLDVLLREMRKDTLVLLGVSTSGCVLSTVKWAGDVGYQMVVVKDACADNDAEVHRVLTEKLFPRQCRVLTAHEFADELARS